MEIIENYLNGNDIPEDQKPVIKRVIHATGDLDFLKSMAFHKEAISGGLRAIRAKKIIYTDVTMVQAGINRRFGHEVMCVINNPEVIEGAGLEGMTRAAYGIKMLGHRLDGQIVAIGNAPTALVTLIEMIKRDDVRPALIVGIPVGFVNARESKEYLTTVQEVPYITNLGQKGAALLQQLLSMPSSRWSLWKRRGHNSRHK